MRTLFTGETGRKILLGSFHIVAGLSILFIWYGLDLDLLAKITQLTSVLPTWTLLIAGLIEGSYWIGGLIPGQTYIGLYLLGNECSVLSSGLAIFYIWAGVLSGLCVSYVAGGFFSKKERVTDTQEWQARKVMGRALLAAYPSAAATHLFERGFQRKSFLPSFIPIIISGLIILSTYTLLLCAAKETIEKSTGEIGFVFAGVLIGWGLWRIAQGVRMRNI